jgi:hypothetical protein
MAWPLPGKTSQRRQDPVLQNPQGKAPRLLRMGANSLCCSEGYFGEFFRRVPAKVGALDDRIQTPNLSISETVDEVIVHHADRLHVRINYSRINEAEYPVFQIVARRIRFLR